jgi:hypothetical protein
VSTPPHSPACSPVLLSEPHSRLKQHPISRERLLPAQPSQPSTAPPRGAGGGGAVGRSAAARAGGLWQLLLSGAAERALESCAHERGCSANPHAARWARRGCCVASGLGGRPPAGLAVGLGLGCDAGALGGRALCQPCMGPLTAPSFWGPCTQHRQRQAQAGVGRTHALGTATPTRLPHAAAAARCCCLAWRAHTHTHTHTHIHTAATAATHTAVCGAANDLVPHVFKAAPQRLAPKLGAWPLMAHRASLPAGVHRPAGQGL